MFTEEIQPESETFGQCSRQLEPEINKRYLFIYIYII